ncbi:MAG: hypothetical protein KAV87_50620 [Desulfobacteraceae bacterium]|nr:hypothetical protein [Desulfobacteraceae bacterium]
MGNPNTIKIYYPDKVAITLGYVTISDLFEGIKKEIENVHRRRRAVKPLPTKIIIKFDRRIS